MEEIIFWVEDAADSGVKKIADKVAGDVELVTDRRPRVLYGTSQEELADVGRTGRDCDCSCYGLEQSRLLEADGGRKENRSGTDPGKTGVLWLVFFLNDPEWHGQQISSDCRER